MNRFTKIDMIGFLANNDKIHCEVALVIKYFSIKNIRCD
jgi:hypothetical protein